MGEIPSIEPNKEIKTSGMTRRRPDAKSFKEHPGGYVMYGGKLTKKEALQQLHPELFLEPDVFGKKHSGFGTQFPGTASKGEIFIRVDTLPNRVFKFDGWRWVEINKEKVTSYLNNEEYIRSLIDMIGKGEYDVRLLTNDEQNQIEKYLRDK